MRAIERIAEEIDPDAVVFPNLIGQPLCDRWLDSKGILSEAPKLEDLVLPSLPNRFLAIVPANQGTDLAKKAAEAVQTRWQEISQAVRLDLEKVLGQSPAWLNTWERQTKNLFETYWYVYPWRPTGKEPVKDKNFYNFLNPHKSYLGNRFEKTEVGEHPNGLEVKLVTAAISRYQTIGGWDVAYNRPKPTYRAVSSGSVYYFETTASSKQILDTFHWQNLADDPLNAQIGFGLTLIGTWNYCNI